MLTATFTDTKFMKLFIYFANMCDCLLTHGVEFERLRSLLISFEVHGGVGPHYYFIKKLHY